MSPTASDTERAEAIVKEAVDGDRGLDSAGLDTDDEIWLEENPQYRPYIEAEIKTKRQEKAQQKLLLDQKNHQKALKQGTRDAEMFKKVIDWAVNYTESGDPDGEPDKRGIQMEPAVKKWWIKNGDNYRDAADDYITERMMEKEDVPARAAPATPSPSHHKHGHRDPAPKTKKGLKPCPPGTRRNPKTNRCVKSHKPHTKKDRREEKERKTLQKQHGHKYDYPKEFLKKDGKIKKNCLKKAAAWRKAQAEAKMAQSKKKRHKTHNRHRHSRHRKK